MCDLISGCFKELRVEAEKEEKVRAQQMLRRRKRRFILEYEGVK